MILDIYNGRMCVTPEFPSGTYAYFISIDSSGNGAYPLIMGPEYYGVPTVTTSTTTMGGGGAGGGGGGGMPPGPPSGGLPTTSTEISVKSLTITYNATIYFCYSECSGSSHLSFSNLAFLMVLGFNLMQL